MLKKALTLAGACALVLGGTLPATAQTPGPTLLDPNLTTGTHVAGLSQPVAMAFIGNNDLLVTEKATGRVKRVTNGVVQATVLDLEVNSASERGLLGITLHPKFPATPWVYLYNTESTIGADTTVISNTTLLGNRVDRFVWNGSALTFDRNIIRLRAFQNDRNSVTDPANPQNNPAPLLRGNHNGGLLKFGPDGKLYVIIGDNGRRGWLQNVGRAASELEDENDSRGRGKRLQFALTPADDEFGGPAPDDAHMTGVVLRLNDDGTTPSDNPFYKKADRIGDRIGGAVGAETTRNLKRIFAYGVRNSFGMAFDPIGKDLWISENGGRAYDEIGRIEPGQNGGWVQVMGPISRVADYKAIELAAGVGAGGPNGLQQLRFPAEAIADNANIVRERLFDVPGAHYRDPEFSWRHVVPPSGIGFVKGNGLGREYAGDLIVGSAVIRVTAAPPSVMANPGHLYRFRLNGGRNKFKFDDPRLQDKVADNTGRDDFVTEGEEILFGLNFGVVSDITTGPDGKLYLVSPSGGSILVISRVP